MQIALHDAFTIPVLCGECGVPFIGMELLGALGPCDGELAEAVAHQASSYRSMMSSVAKGILNVERILDAYQLPRLPRPTTYDDYTRWADAACRSVLAATGPEVAEGAVAGFARALARVLVPIALTTMILRLRAIAPDDVRLRADDEHLLSQLREGVAHLDGMSKFSTLPESVRADAERLAALGRLSLLLDPAKIEMRKGGLDMIDRKLEEHTAAFGTKLSA